MKVAIFHNFLDNIGGAEIVTLCLARNLNADVYTTVFDKDKINKMGFADVLPRIKSIGKVPINAPFRHQKALYLFRYLDVAKRFGITYDRFIISGDWAVSGAVLNKPSLWYVHSPPRELFDLHKYVRNEIVSWWQRPIFDMWSWFNKKLFLNYSTQVNSFVCNSTNTQKRLKKFLHKESIVIHPPVDVSQYYHKKSKGYWLSVNRLLKHKRVDLQMKAFSKMSDEKLVIVGSYEQAKHFKKYATYLNKLKPTNVEIRSWVSDNELKNLYAECKGLICTAKDEDFGMSPLEAMASGKPVIAVNEGGYKETVVDGVTGKLIKAEVAGLIDAIQNHSSYSKSDCMKHAKEFDVKNFVKKIRGELK